MAELSNREQFLYGLLGGVLATFMVLYSTQVNADQPWPDWRKFSTWIHALKWVGFPLAAGASALICEPRHKLAAAYEGMSTLGLLYLVARHLPH